MARTRIPGLFSDESVRRSVKQLIMENMPDVILASIRCATEGGVQAFPDRQMLAKIAGVFVPSSQTTVTGETTVHLRSAAELSDDDLASIAAGGSR